MLWKRLSHEISLIEKLLRSRGIEISLIETSKGWQLNKNSVYLITCLFLPHTQTHIYGPCCRPLFSNFVVFCGHFSNETVKSYLISTCIILTCLKILKIYTENSYHVFVTLQTLNTEHRSAIFIPFWTHTRGQTLQSHKPIKSKLVQWLTICDTDEGHLQDFCIIPSLRLAA